MGVTSFDLRETKCDKKWFQDKKKTQNEFRTGASHPNLDCRSVCSSASQEPFNNSQGCNSPRKKTAASLMDRFLCTKRCCLILNTEDAFKEPQNLAEECLHHTVDVQLVCVICTDSATYCSVTTSFR